jgi:hypothetical protein
MATENKGNAAVVKFALNVTTVHAGFHVIDNIAVDAAVKHLTYWQKETHNIYEGRTLQKELVFHNIRHQYMLSDKELEELLDSANIKPWIKGASEMPIHDRHNSRFQFAVTYSDGTTYTREGWYDRRSIDFASPAWERFIVAIKRIICKGSTQYLLDKKTFIDVPLPGEQRYAHICADNSENAAGVYVKSSWIKLGTTVKVTERNGCEWVGKVDRVIYHKEGIEPTPLRDVKIKFIDPGYGEIWQQQAEALMGIW